MGSVVMKLFSIFSAAACVAQADFDPIYDSAYDPIYDDKSTYPKNGNGMGPMFATFPYTPEHVELEYRGRIPEWITGTFYRNGPGIYEWGETKYDHFFDPTAVLQGVHVKDGRITYNSNVIKSRNYEYNNAAQQIIKPEIGTYGEPDWVTAYENGTMIEDQAEIIENRLKFFMEMGFATDNTLIQVTPLGGMLVSMTETTYWNYHDPYTLETLGQIDIKKAKNFPKGFFCVTNTAHPHFDLKTGDFWNVMGCLDLPNEESLVPRTAYITYKIPGAGREAKDMFLNPWTVDELLDRIEFGEPFYNERKTDVFLRYFHMTSITENYIVIPLNSLLIDFAPLIKGIMVETRPLADFMRFDDDTPGEIIVFDKKTMKALPKRWHGDPFLMLHMMNCYEDPEDPTKIVLDGTTTAGDVIDYYAYKFINSTDDMYTYTYDKMSPIGVPRRYIIDLAAEPDRRGIVRTDYTLHFEPSEDSDFPCFEKGGLEFPIINFYNHDGYYYNHYWGCGFGEVLPDRLYHVEISSKTRHVWQVPEYSPSEPVFVQNPYLKDEDEGVIISIVSPYKSWTATPFIVFLNAKDMKEIARAELPDGYYIPTGFHSYFIADDNVPMPPM